MQACKPRLIEYFYKMMHVLDYDRALGELLELDNTVKQTIDRACPCVHLDAKLTNM